MLLTSSAEKGENKANNRGVDTVFSPRSYKVLNPVKNINPRIMIGLFRIRSQMSEMNDYRKIWYCK